MLKEPDNIVPIDNKWKVKDILSFLDQIDEFLSIKANTDNPDFIADKLADAVMFYPSSANALASAKWYAETIYRQEYDKIVGIIKERDTDGILAKITSPTNLKKYIESRCADFNHLYKRAERANSSLTHACDSYRSLLSKAKEDRRISSYQSNLPRN